MSGPTSFVSLLPVAAGVGGTFGLSYVRFLHYAVFIPSRRQRKSDIA